MTSFRLTCEVTQADAGKTRQPRAHISGAKAKVCYPIEDFDYGMREFGIYDNNGYLIRFGKPLD